MRWAPLGQIWKPDGSLPWAKTHAHLPTPLVLEDRIRVFVACLDEHNFGRITFVDVAPDDPTRILYDHREVCLDIGELGSFDDCGVVPSCALRVGDRIYLYYVGFQRAERVPYMLFSGLAIAKLDEMKFERVARCPILDRTAEEPFSRGAPFVSQESEGFRMWYWSCTHWSKIGDRVNYNNVIKHATSKDGVSWAPDHEPLVSPVGDEFAVGRPWVIRENGRYEMYFSIRARSEPYRIEAATSDDGISWKRIGPPQGLSKDPTTTWADEMVCYPAIVRARNRYLAFFNGNAHGKTGFGCAVREV